MLWGSCIAYFVAAWLLISSRRLPYSNGFETLLSTCVATTSLFLILLAATREFYSGSFFAVFLAFQALWFGLELFFRNRFAEYAFMLFPTTIQVSAKDFPGHKIVFHPASGNLDWEDIDAAIVDFNVELDGNWLAVLAHCQNHDVPILPLTLFLENTWGRIPIDLVKTTKFLETPSFRPYLRIKPVLEWLLAATALVVASPVMLAVAALVKCTSKGPVIFRQERVGSGGKRFSIYKFRTMLEGMDRLGSYPVEKNDKRLTCIGRKLRRYHFDELPQLLNVLKGDLAIVGPRPEALDTHDHYEEHMPYSLRTAVKQGVVSWALIHQGNVAGVEAGKVKLSYDLYYIKHASLFLDAYIILKTVWIILFGIETLKTPAGLGVFAGKKEK